MAAFAYVALDQSGKRQKGIWEADSSRQVRQMLRDKSWAPLTVDESSVKVVKKGNTRRSPSISSQELALIMRQWATLIQAGLPIEEVLQAVAEQSEKAKIKALLVGVRAKVLEGHGLADSMLDYPQSFPNMYCTTVAAGERSGHLDLVLNNLADYAERSQETQQKIQLALLYPIILMVVCLGIVAALMGYVVPDIVDMFISSGQKLPGLTLFLIALSDFVVNYGVFVLIATIAFIFGFRQLLKGKSFRLEVHRRILGVPLIGRLARGTNVARFASTLSILTASGVALVEAMKIAGAVLSNNYLQQSIVLATRDVSEGSSLKLALENSGYFPPMMIHMIASGEATGELENMLSRIAVNQEREYETTLATLVGLLTPAITLMMGGVVMLIVLAILMPLMSMNSLVL